MKINLVDGEVKMGYGGGKLTEGLMMKFVYMAECMPAKVDTWFRGFHHGGVIEADSLEAAQEKLNELCRGYGSDTDPRFINGGPYAQAMITRRK